MEISGIFAYLDMRVTTAVCIFLQHPAACSDQKNFKSPYNAMEDQ